MVTFTEFIESAASKREFVNVFFEQRVFELIGTLQKLSTPLEDAGVQHELVGGLAVFLHVENADSTHSSLTRDIDVMIRREDLPRIVEIAEASGFRFRHSAGLDMLLYGETSSPRNAVHLWYSGEKVKSSQVEAHPNLHPVRVGLHGQEFWVIPVADLLRMKLSSFRDKDRVHVRGMDAAGLITSDVERSLGDELGARLVHVRDTE
ncbi:MAG: nucleotidyltransferase family protein [Acidobacteria bacterium]|nr:nucleotidyltransferase family protein [Acidobacteriota bacterium]